MAANEIKNMKVVSIRKLGAEELKLFHGVSEPRSGVNTFELEVEADCDEDTAKRALETLLKSFDEEGEVWACSVKQ